MSNLSIGFQPYSSDSSSQSSWRLTSYFFDPFEYPTLGFSSGDIVSFSNIVHGTPDVITYAPSVIPWGRTVSPLPPSSSDYVTIPGMVGVFLGCSYSLPAGAPGVTRQARSNSFPAGTKILKGTLVECFVCDDIDQLFNVRMSRVGITASGIFANVGVKCPVGGPDVTRGVSNQEISGLTTSASAPFKIVGRTGGGVRGDSDQEFDYFLVKMNSAFQRSGTAGVLPA